MSEEKLSKEEKKARKEAKEARKEEKKDKAKKKEIKDANGNILKRPLSAYMLYNNHRRPTLRSEHPGK